MAHSSSVIRSFLECSSRNGHHVFCLERKQIMALTIFGLDAYRGNCRLYMGPLQDRHYFVFFFSFCFLPGSVSDSYQMLLITFNSLFSYETDFSLQLFCQN